MLLNRNKLFATNHKQRWSIRKLTIGIVSVLVGTTIVFINSTNTVFSDQLDSKTENISKATELISDDNTARTVGEETSSDLPETVTEETVSLVNDKTVEAQNEDSTLTETSDSEETQVITPENEDAVNTNTAETVSTAKQQNEDDTLKNKTVVQASAPVSVATTKVDTHDKASLTRNQIQAQSSGSQYQPKESDERKEESSGVSEANYYAIFREVTIVKPDGQEEVLPYQVLGSIYFNSDESKNNQLQKLEFGALEAPPMEGYNSPVIPAISVSISDFLNNDITDPTYDDYLYDGHHPIQRQSLEVVPLPEDTKYDDDYYRFSDEFDKKYKDEYDLRDDDFDALLIKEKYYYTKEEDPKPVEGKEEKTITRTINVHLPSGEVQTTKQPVTIKRTYTSVAGSDDKNYGPWTTGIWEAFTAPELAGYTALPTSVDKSEVTFESLDAVVDIYYRTDDPAIVSGKEEKTITRTINVHLPSGEVQTTKQPVTLERTYTSVAGSDTKKYGPWTTGIWEAFTAPELVGYTALPTSVDAVEVTSESLDAVVDIYYRIDDPAIVSGKEEKTITRTINAYLPSGEVQTTKQPVTLERTYTSVAGSDEKDYGPWTTGIWEAFTAPELAGYTALPASVDESEVTSESLDAVVDIYYRTDDPAIVSGEEEKTITRTINVHLPSGEVQTTKQPVTIKRAYTSVVGSDTKKYGPWTTGIWEAFTAPKLAGYTALPTSVDESEVTSDTLDAIVDIYYRADVPVLPATPVDPTDPSNPTTPVDPTDPSTPTTPVTPTDPSTPTTPVHPADPPTPTTPVTPTDPSTSTTPVHPTDPPTPTINVKNNISNELASSSKVEDEVDATTDSQEKLPQTGNKSSVIYSIFGLILTSLLGVWAFVRKH